MCMLTPIKLTIIHSVHQIKVLKSGLDSQLRGKSTKKPSNLETPHHTLEYGDTTHHTLEYGDTTHHTLEYRDTTHHTLEYGDTTHHTLEYGDTNHHTLEYRDTTHHTVKYGDIYMLIKVSWKPFLLPFDSSNVR